jgi:hypothetical protein
VDGTCPATAEGNGKEWSATLTVARDSGGGDSGGGGEGAEGGDKEGGDGIGGIGGTDDIGGTEATEATEATEGTEGTEGTEATEATEGTEGGKVGPGGGGRPCAEAHSDGTQPHPGVPHEAEPQQTQQEEGNGGHPDATAAHPDDCASAVTERGVRAGAGGAFTDSVPALVAGGLLIAGALGGAVYRLRRGTPAAGG